MDPVLLFVLVYGVVAFALYWIIRLAVRHGIQDVRRDERSAAAAAGVSETIRRQRATYGGLDEG